MLLPAAAGTVTLYAVYPAASTAAHVVARDQTTAAGYQASDLMYATTTVADNERESTRSLVFQHQLVKLTVAVTKPADVSVLGGVALKGVSRKVGVTPSASGIVLGTAEAAASGDAGYDADAAVNNSISFGAVEDASNSAQTYTYACVLPETTWAADDDFLTVTLDGQLVTYKLGANTTLTAGRAYTLTMTATPNGMDGSTATLAAWGTLTEGTVAALTDQNALTIADIEDQTWVSTGCEPAVTVSKNGTTLVAADYDVAYIDNRAVGTATVIVLGKGTYAGKGGTKTFHIVKKNDAAISYATASITDKSYGDANFTNTLTNTGDGTVTYASNDVTVATVDTNTGEVTILKPGTTTITATAANSANSDYATATATYTLTVGKKTVTLSPASPSALAFTSSDAKDATVTSTQEFTCSEGNEYITVTSSNTSNFTVSYSTSTKKITITRVSESAFSGNSVTVSTTELSADYYDLPTNLTVAVSAVATLHPVDPSTITASDIASNRGTSTNPRAYVVCEDGDLHLCQNGTEVNPGSSVESPVYLSSDGTLSCGKNKLAVLCYAGSAGSVDGSSGATSYRCLAIALTDANGGNTCQWYTANSGTCTVQNSAIATALGYMNGIEYTNTLTGDGHTHAAATKAKDYASTGADGTNVARTSTWMTSNTSGWFLPSIGQWNLVVKGLTGGTNDLGTSANPDYTASAVNKYIQTAAGGAEIKSSNYWSSVEGTTYGAWYVYFGNGGASGSGKDNSYYVRPVLAF